MKILMAGPERNRLLEFLRAFGDSVVTTEDKLSPTGDILEGVDWLISYGYRHIMRDNVLQLLPGRIINLHISLLPWNRGADPNLWSFLEDTPKGVSIHSIDAGIDTGDILAQKPVDNAPDDTLRTSYDRLCREIESLFIEVWSEIREGERRGIPQSAGGSCHRLRDKESFAHLLVKGWDTPVADLIGRALVSR